MSTEFNREYLLRVPLPLAQLYSPAHNAPAARARHDYTFYLFEALIKLAACPHVMAYLHEVEQGARRVQSLDRLLAQLALPSLGQWVAILRELEKHFGKRPYAASHPLGHVWEQLNSKRRDLSSEEAGGHSGWTGSYHGNRQVKEKTFLGYDGSGGYCQIRHRYDENGKQLEELYLDDQGIVTNQQSGFARIVMKYDDRGNQVELISFDNKGKLATVANGIARFTSDYDEKGNKVAEKFYGVDGELALGEDGFARWLSSYDSAGRHTSRKYFGLQYEQLDIEVVVTSVVPESQGEGIGAEVGDVLVRYDGDEVADTRTFIDDRKQESDPKKARILEVEREGKPLKFEVFPGLLGLGITDRVISKAEKAPDS